MPIRVNIAISTHRINRVLNRSGSSSYPGSVMVIHQALDSYGVNADAVLSSCGMNIDSIRNNPSRIPEERYDELILKSIEACEDPAFGLRYAEFCHPTTFNALGLALLASETLKDYCDRWVRYFALINTSETVTFGTENGAAFLADTRIPSNAVAAVERAHEDAFLALVVKYIRLMYQPNYVPKNVSSIWPIPDTNVDAYINYFGIEPEFNAPQNAVFISQTDLNTPLPAANAALAQQNDQVVVGFLAKLNRVDIPSQVNRKLIELLPSGDCTNEKVANSLNMSVKALYNKLVKADTSYQELLDSTREQLARQYMLRMELGVGEVAYLLGFTDSSNFSRAFRRWTNLSPSEFREQNNPAADDSSENIK